MQGADLSHADLADCELNETFVFRANIADANLATAAVGEVYADRVTINNQGDRVRLTPADIDAWIAVATRFRSRDDYIVKHFDRLKSDFQDGPDEVKWSGMREAALVLDAYGDGHRQRLAKLIGDLACESAGAPYVARSLVRQGSPWRNRLWALGNQFNYFSARLEEGRKTPEKCLGVVGFTEDDWRRLEAIKPK